MDNLVKFKLSQYTNIENLNSEGTAILAYDKTADRLCVKKFVDKKACEIYKKLMNINDNNIPQIYDILEYDENYLIIEEYIKGKSIDRIVEERGRLTRDESLSYMVDVCTALEAIHSYGIIHRDVTPGNVIADENGRARLLDFDIARESKQNQSMDTAILGTAGFASPEQFGFAQTDERSDIFSLGVLLNYMLTGHIVQMGVYENEPLRSVIVKATKISAVERYRTVGEFKNEIAYNKKNIIVNRPVLNGNKISSDRKIDFGFIPMPGFRTNTLWKKVVAVFFYIFFFIYIIDMFIETGFSAETLGMDIMYIVVYLVPMWWFGNEGRQWDIMPFVRNMDKKSKKITAIVAYIILLFSVSLLTADMQNKN